MEYIKTVETMKKKKMSSGESITENLNLKINTQYFLKLKSMREN